MRKWGLFARLWNTNFSKHLQDGYLVDAVFKISSKNALFSNGLAWKWYLSLVIRSEISQLSSRACGKLWHDCIISIKIQQQKKNFYKISILSSLAMCEIGGWYDGVMTWKRIRVAGSLWVESIDHRPLTKFQYSRGLMFCGLNIKTAKQTVDLPVIWNTRALIWPHCNGICKCHP